VIKLVTGGNGEDYSRVRGADVRSSVTKEIIEAGTHLKIGRAGVGVDNADVAAATQGIVVVNSPERNTIAAAEHAVAMMSRYIRCQLFSQKRQVGP